MTAFGMGMSMSPNVAPETTRDIAPTIFGAYFSIAFPTFEDVLANFSSNHDSSPGTNFPAGPAFGGLAEAIALAKDSAVRVSAVSGTFTV